MRALEPFCGMGGASLGMERAGFQVTGFEIDAKAAELHRHVCEGSVGEHDVAALDPTRMEVPDLLWMSPPCQPFSQAGLRKGLDDPRAHLIFEVPRWVKAMRPRMVICEQVKQALHWWEAFAEEFQALGYHTWVGVVNSEQFGVPQTRQRAILLASLDGPVNAPQPTHRKYHTRAPHTRPGDEHLLPYVTMADVIDVDAEDRIGFGRKDDKGGDGLRERDFRPGDEPAFTVTSKGRSWSVNTGRDWKPGGDRSTAQTRDMDLPAPALTSNSSKGWQLSNWRQQRLITVADGLALQGFPPDCLDGATVTKTAAFKAIGNAVPVQLAEALARHLSTNVTPVTGME